MPELPEVETTRRALIPVLQHKTIKKMIVREPHLRWSIDRDIPQMLQGRRCLALVRRGKYLLLSFTHGTLLIHLGMSGSLSVVPLDRDPTKHDHVDFVLTKCCIRLCDPRRFGSIFWTAHDPDLHPRLAHLGPDPLDPTLSSHYYYERSRTQSRAVKLFLMDNRITPGIGNIYANEILFIAGVDPRKAAKTLTRLEWHQVYDAVVSTLNEAIRYGGSTLRDFQFGNNRLGYFQMHFNVYDRSGKPCPRCQSSVTRITLGQRGTFLCLKCQR